MAGTPSALNSYSAPPPRQKKGPYFGMTPGDLAGMAVDLVAGSASAPAELAGSAIAGGMKGFSRATAVAKDTTTMGRAVGEAAAGKARSISALAAPESTIAGEKSLAKSLGRPKYRPSSATEEAKINDAAKWGDSMMAHEPPDHLPYNLEKHNGLHVKNYEHVEVYGSEGLEPTGVPSDSEHVYVHFTPASTNALQKEAVATQQTGLHYSGVLGPAGREADTAMEEVLRVYPNSKIHLGGYSMGGATTERQMAKYATNPNVVEGVTIHGNTSGLNRLATATEARVNGTAEAMDAKLTHLKYEGDAISGAGNAHGEQYTFMHPDGPYDTMSIHGKQMRDIPGKPSSTGFLTYKGDTPFIKAGGDIGQAVEDYGLATIKGGAQIKHGPDRGQEYYTQTQQQTPQTPRQYIDYGSFPNPTPTPTPRPTPTPTPPHQRSGTSRTRNSSAYNPRVHGHGRLRFG